VKSFAQFLGEAVKTAASTQAKQRGLVGDGHGGWYDAKGNFVAKTVNKKLKFTGSRGAGEEEEAPQQGGPAATATPTKPKAPEPAPTPKAAAAPPPDVEQSGEVFGTDDLQQQTAEKMGEATSEGVVIVFGRFNPPTTGHEKLLQAAKDEADRQKSDLRIYPSRSVDPKKNPLQPGAKIDYMKKMFPDYEEDIRDDANSKTIFDVLVACQNVGYKGVTIVVGQDRLNEFQGLSQKYNGDVYEFEEINVVSAGERDADAEGLEGMSASKLRKAAMDGNFKEFVKGVPNIGNDEKMNLFKLLQKSMGVKKDDKKKDKKSDKEKSAARYQEDEKGKKAAAKKRDYASARSTAVDDAIKKHGTVSKHDKVKESYELWEIAPKLDPFGLRIAYLREEIFKIGSLVESLQTGEVGRITRRGANHVICQTAEGNMFKSWLRDISEAYDVGTDNYRDYVQSMTPGQPVKKFHDKSRILPITTGSFYDGKPKKKPEDPPSGPGTKFN